MHPLQGRDLVEQAPIGGRPVDLREALDTHAIVERHHDDTAVPCEAPAVVLRQACRADPVGATLNPHHDRQSRARTGFGRPDVDRQPVVARVTRQGVHAERPGLRRGWAERHGLPYPGRCPHRSRCGEPAGADRRLGEGDAAEDGDIALPAAAQCPGRRPDFGVGCGSVHRRSCLRRRAIVRTRGPGTADPPRTTRRAPGIYCADGAGRPTRLTSAVRSHWGPDLLGTARCRR